MKHTSNRRYESGRAVFRCFRKKEIHSLADAADRLLCRSAVGLPFFFAVMALVFFLSFSGPGDLAARLAERELLFLGDRLKTALETFGVSDRSVRYLIDGVYTGVASAVAFLPQTAIFFFLIGFLADCGYLSRAVFVTDRFFRSFGLSGNAVIPLMVGCGCAIPSLSVLSHEQGERRSVVRALPFVLCNARLPVLLYLTDAFFPQSKTAAAIFFWALSFVLVLLSLVADAAGNGEAPDLITELPPFRLPSLRTLLREAALKSRDYLVRAGTTVFLSCAVFSSLAMLSPALGAAASEKESLLYRLAEALSLIFRPLGFDCAEAAAALLLGFFAKENIVYAFRILSDLDPEAILAPPAAAAFTAFALFYTPCLALFSGVAKESGIAGALMLLIRTFAVAYAVSGVLYTLSYIILCVC